MMTKQSSMDDVGLDMDDGDEVFEDAAMDAEGGNGNGAGKADMCISTAAIL